MLRKRLIELLQYDLRLLQDENIPLEKIDLDFWLGRRPYEVHRHLRRVEDEIRALRDELRERSEAPVRCAYSDDQGTHIRFISGLPGHGEADKKFIKKKSHSNEWMIIADPYFLQWDGPNKAFATEKLYTEFIVDFIPLKLKKLELFILPCPNKRIFKKFNDRIRSRGTNVSYRETTEIHDRVIVRDNNTGTLMGTSFGGYSNKLSFVLDIPPRDLETFMGELDRIRNF
jgi:hypothetical protein